MTKENSKKLYDHYVKIGYNKAAENLLLKYPDFKSKTETKEKIEKPKK